MEKTNMPGCAPANPNPVKNNCAAPGNTPKKKEEKSDNTAAKVVAGAAVGVGAGVAGHAAANNLVNGAESEVNPIVDGAANAANEVSNQAAQHQQYHPAAEITVENEEQIENPDDEIIEDPNEIQIDIEDIEEDVTTGEPTAGEDVPQVFEVTPEEFTEELYIDDPEDGLGDVSIYDDPDGTPEIYDPNDFPEVGDDTLAFDDDAQSDIIDDIL